jgi:hypothetical protein
MAETLLPGLISSPLQLFYLAFLVSDFALLLVQLALKLVEILALSLLLIAGPGPAQRPERSPDGRTLGGVATLVADDGTGPRSQQRPGDGSFFSLGKRARRAGGDKDQS